MKKIISILTLISVIFAFAGCQDKKSEESTVPPGKDVMEETLVNASAPVVSLSCSEAEVKPGDEVKVTLNISNTKYLASMDIDIAPASAAEYVDKEINSIPGFIMEGNSRDGGKFSFGAYVAQTIDLEDNDLCVITYKIKDTVPSGTVIEFNPEVRSFSLGTDESGDETVSVAKDVNIKGCSVTVV